MQHTPVGLGGQEYGDILLLVFTISMSLLMAAVGQHACLANKGGVTCCTAVNSGLFIVGLTLGIAIGLYGTALGGAAVGAMSVPVGFTWDAIWMAVPIDCSKYQ